MRCSKLLCRPSAPSFRRYQGREQEAVAILDGLAASLPEIERQVPDDKFAALALLDHYGLRGDRAATRRWIEVFRERLIADHKNDRYLVSVFRFCFAVAYANAGLDDEAIAELRVMLDEPGGRRFTMIDAYPAFERFKGRPE